MLLRFLPFFEDDDGKPQGGAPKPSDVLEQYGRDALRLAEKLADVQADNYRLREERRGLKSQIAETQSKVPSEGSKVLSADEAAEYAAYLALGKPKDVKAALDTKGTAEQELTALKREKLLSKAAEAAGFKASVLERLAGDLQIELEAKDGKPLVYVVKDGEKVALADYAEKEWADFLPALQQKAAPLAPDINAGSRGGGDTPLMTDEERVAARRRYAATF